MITTLRESKAKLSALVELAAHGEEVVITVHGKPKARLSPISPRQPAGQSRGKWLDELQTLRTRHTIKTGNSSADILDEIRGDRL